METIMSSLPCMICEAPVELPYREIIAFKMSNLQLVCEDCKEVLNFEDECQARRNNLSEKGLPLSVGC